MTWNKSTVCERLPVFLSANGVISSACKMNNIICRRNMPVGRFDFSRLYQLLNFAKKEMKNKFILPALLLFPVFVMSQKVDWKKINSYPPDKVLLGGERQPTQVLLLGTFHFGYPNLDGHKTDSSLYVDVKSAQRQREIEELAEVIERFRPTRVYVESGDQSRIDSLYNEYRQGHYQLGRNEIYQIGFRVAGHLNHSKLYAVDAWPFSGEFSDQYKWIDSLWNFSAPVDSARDKYWAKKYKEWYTSNDSLKLRLTMLENFLFMAEPATLQRMHGHYVASGFSTKPLSAHDGGQQGPDILSIWWYNRNLRIFNKILRTRPTAEDRIVVLFGNGHMPILRQCFYSSPEFQIVELKSLLKK